MLAQGWTAEIHYDLEGDAYYHPKLLTLVHRYHPGGTIQYRTEHWTHPEGTRVRYIHCAITARLTRAAVIRDAARQMLVVNRDRHFDDIA